MTETHGLLSEMATVGQRTTAQINSSAPRESSPAIHIPVPRAKCVVSRYDRCARRYAQIQTDSDSPWWCLGSQRHESIFSRLCALPRRLPPIVLRQRWPLPLSGKQLACVGERCNPYGRRLLLQVDDGTICSVPDRWTDLVASDPKIVLGKHRALFRVADLLQLARLVDQLGRGDSLEKKERS
jgi:hypothetical protein